MVQGVLSDHLHGWSQQTLSEELGNLFDGLKLDSSSSMVTESDTESIMSNKLHVLQFSGKWKENINEFISSVELAFEPSAKHYANEEDCGKVKKIILKQNCAGQAAKFTARSKFCDLTWIEAVDALKKRFPVEDDDVGDDDDLVDRISQLR